MRKFFALALAVAMVFSLASVSFAAYVNKIEGFTDGEAVYKYSGDSDKMEATTIEYGKAGYIQLVESGKGVNDFDQVEKLKIKAEFEMGEDLVESISIVKKYIKPDASEFDYAWDAKQSKAVLTGPAAIIDDDGDVLGVTYTFDYSGGTNQTNFGVVTTEAAFDSITNVVFTVDPLFDADYYYFIEFKTVKERVTGDSDVIGTLEFNRKANNKVTPAVAKIDDEEVDFSFNVWYENNYLSTGKVTDAGFEFKWDDIYVLKFEGDDEAELTFGKYTFNEGTFTVDISGQSKMVVDFNTKANEAICAANTGAKMFFVNFNGAKFNRTGEFEYEMEDIAAAYQVIDDKLVEIPGLELDVDTATFSTSVLGNYVFANTELVNPVAEAPVVEAPVATNPATGGY